MTSTYLAELEQTYAHSAGWHDWFTRLYSLGQEQRLRQGMVERMALAPGSAVLDVACGTGLNFQALQSFIGPEGQIIGIDYSPAMLEHAQVRVRQHGWQNVVLQRGDAAQLHLDRPVDGALCTLAIGLMPEPRAVLRRMLEAVKPGGVVLIADGRLSRRWYGPVINPILRIVGSPWLPPYSRQQYFEVEPWQDLRALMDSIHYEEWLGGTVYVAWGRKP